MRAVDADLPRLGRSFRRVHLLGNIIKMNTDMKMEIRDSSLSFLAAQNPDQKWLRRDCEVAYVLRTLVLLVDVIRDLRSRSLALNMTRTFSHPLTRIPCM